MLYDIGRHTDIHFFVVGCDGMSGFMADKPPDSYCLGSVSEKIVKEARCTVVVV